MKKLTKNQDNLRLKSVGILAGIWIQDYHYMTYEWQPFNRDVSLNVIK
jgi:hypothetical protein